MQRIGDNKQRGRRRPSRCGRHGIMMVVVKKDPRRPHLATVNLSRYLVNTHGFPLPMVVSSDPRISKVKRLQMATIPKQELTNNVGEFHRP
jgi:hypothetical protein